VITVKTTVLPNKSVAALYNDSVRKLLSPVNKTTTDIISHLDLVEPLLQKDEELL
jgi:hypothetical protein